MCIEKALFERSGSRCELCAASENIDIYEVPPNSTGGMDDSEVLCNTCMEQIEHPERLDVNHWRCLNESMWSQVPAV